MPWLDLEEGIADLFDESKARQLLLVEVVLHEKAERIAERKRDYTSSPIGKAKAALRRRARTAKEKAARALDPAPAKPRRIHVAKLRRDAPVPIGVCLFCGGRLSDRRRPRWCSGVCRERFDKRVVKHPDSAWLIPAKTPSHFVVVLVREQDVTTSPPIKDEAEALRVARGAVAFHGPGTRATVEQIAGPLCKVIARFDLPKAA